jgi:hypothetical protein
MAESFFWPRCTTILKVRHRRLLCQIELGRQGARATPDFASRKTMVVDWGLVLRQGSRNSYKHHIMLRVNGKSRRFDMQRLLLSASFPSGNHARTLDHTAEVMVPRLVGGDYGSIRWSMTSSWWTWAHHQGKIGTGCVTYRSVHWRRVSCRARPQGIRAVAVRLRLPHYMVSMDKQTEPAQTGRRYQR